MILGPLTPTAWPRFIAIDSLPLRTRGYRKGEKVGNLEAGEILVAIDHTARRGVPVLMQVQGGKDSDCWKAFFASLTGEPEWIEADLDDAIAKAVKETWPKAILFRSRDHLMRLMRDRALLDGIPSAVRIKNPEKRAPRRASGRTTSRSRSSRRTRCSPRSRRASAGRRSGRLRALARSTSPPRRSRLRGWLATNEPLIRVQWELADKFRGRPVGSGNVEGVIREFLGKHVEPRAGRMTNVARLNRVLGLMTLQSRAEAREARYAGLLRTHFAERANRSGVEDWRACQDPDEDRSLPRLVHECDERQEARERVDARRRKAIERLRRLQEGEARRQQAGLSPLHRGRRVGRRARQSTRGKMVADFPAALAEWDWSLNPDKDPAATPASKKDRVVWRCALDPDDVRTARIFDRFNGGHRCPFCMGVRVHPKESLAALFGEITGEWHPTKNRSLRAYEVLPGSGRRAWWRCGKGHELPAYIFSRTKQQTNCPRCFRERQPELARAGAARRRRALATA